MGLPSSPGRMAELVGAVLILAAGIYFYRRRDPSGTSYGNQGAVILLVVAAIMLAHALGLFDYRPSAAEAEYLRDRSQ